MRLQYDFGWYDKRIVQPIVQIRRGYSILSTNALSLKLKLIFKEQELKKRKITQFCNSTHRCYNPLSKYLSKNDNINFLK